MQSVALAVVEEEARETVKTMDVRLLKENYIKLKIALAQITEEKASVSFFYFCRPLQI